MHARAARCRIVTRAALAGVLLLLGAADQAAAQQVSGGFGASLLVLPPAAPIEFMVSPTEAGKLAPGARASSRVRIATKQRFVVEVNGQRLQDSDGHLDVSVDARGAVTRVPPTRGVRTASPTRNPASQRSFTLGLGPRVNALDRDANVRIGILLGADGGT